jgi:DedD protein
VASKFQNRLVGTIVLVALGVIIRQLLDGQKKHYQDEFARSAGAETGRSR